METDYDAIVIGSGFGGAITACRLAQAGHSVCILEKGGRWPVSSFPRSPGEVSRDAFVRPGATYPGRGFIEYLTFRNMDVVQGTGVGGGSLHYFNVHIRPPADILDGPAWPRGLSLRKLRPYFRLAAGMLAANTLEQEREHEIPPRTHAFEDAVDSIGLKPRRVPVCVHLDPGSDQTCRYCGNCLLGCHVGAKNTLDRNYIPLAEHHGARVLAHHKALNITPVASGYRVTCQDLSAAPAQPAGDALRELTGRRVIVAAGTLGTNELLLRCKYRYRTLPQLSDRLGHGYSGNGDFLFAGTRYRDRVVDPGRGPSITAGVGFRDRSDQYIFIEDLGYPDPFIWYLNGILPTPGRPGRALQHARRYLSDATGGRLRFGIGELLDDGAATRFLPYLGMGTDAADGRLALNRRGELELHWSSRRSLPMFTDMIRHMKELSYRSGGQFVNSFQWRTPLFRLPLRKTLTAHPLGGCAMSDTPRDGVTNDSGEVWGYPGLYVADGALLPGPLGVNPSATISALAERVAFRLLHQRELRDRDEMTPANAPPGEPHADRVTEPATA